MTSFIELLKIEKRNASFELILKEITLRDFLEKAFVKNVKGV